MVQCFFKPFNLDNCTVATDGKIIVFAPKDDSYPDFDSGIVSIDGISKYRDECFYSIDEYFPLQSIKYREKNTCKECDGTGKLSIIECPECNGLSKVIISNSFNSYECECQSCIGEGRIFKSGVGNNCNDCKGLSYIASMDETVEIFGEKFLLHYVEMILDNFSNVSAFVDYLPDRKCGIMYFKADGGIKGVLMGIYNC